MRNVMSRDETDQSLREGTRGPEIAAPEPEDWGPADLRGWPWDRLTSTFRALDAEHAELVSVLEDAARERHAAEFEHWAQLMGEEPYPAHDVIFNTQRLALNHRRSLVLAEAVRRLLEDFGVEPGDLSLRLEMMEEQGLATRNGERLP